MTDPKMLSQSTVRGYESFVYIFIKACFYIPQLSYVSKREGCWGVQTANRLPNELQTMRKNIKSLSTSIAFWSKWHEKLEMCTFDFYRFCSDFSLHVDPIWYTFSFTFLSSNSFAAHSWVVTSGLLVGKDIVILYSWQRPLGGIPQRYNIWDIYIMVSFFVNSLFCALMQPIYSFRCSFTSHLAMCPMYLMSMIVHCIMLFMISVLCFRNIMILSTTLTVTLNCSILIWL